MLMPLGYRELLYMNLELAKQGEYWRFITGHFTHYNWLHCISNIMGVFLLFLLFQPSPKKDQWIIVTAFILTFVTLGLIISSESLRWYLGFSGILTGRLATRKGGDPMSSGLRVDLTSPGVGFLPESSLDGRA